MASVADLVGPDVLERLATTEDLQAGSVLADASAVRFTTIGPLNVLATVESDGASTHVELRGGSVLTFECSCDAGRAGAFCRHVVAVATETWRRAPERRRSPAPSGAPPPSEVPTQVPERPTSHVQPRGRPEPAPSMGRPLQVGLQLPEVEREVRWPELRDIARTAEAVGFDSLWLGDHLLYRRPGDHPRGPWEVWTTLAGLAEATERVALGPLVASTSFHNPAMLAKMATTVDEISGGRLILGLGAGWNETEYRAFGFPFDQRISRFEEAFTIIRTLLREGAIDFDGRFYQARDCELIPRGPRQGGPPLMVGSIGPRMLRLTLPHVDAWNAWFADTGNGPAGIAPLRQLVDATCREVGRDPGAVARTVAVLVQLPGGTGRFHGDPSQALPTPLSGTAKGIAEGLAAYADEGISHVQIVLDPITAASVEGMGAVLEHLDRA
jgi:alkanesulfonate monooxygenase SsuD/methylene tetrahydromethanopterin reductase-like flavin-dependent oxidoreductase (luciferase family)